MARVVCTLLAMGWMVVYYALGWRGPVLVLEDLIVGLTYARFDSTYVVW